jgi:hypothetical protein
MWHWVEMMLYELVVIHKENMMQLDHHLAVRMRRQKVPQSDSEEQYHDRCLLQLLKSVYV